MVVGIIIGSSIFVQPSSVTAQIHSVTWVLLVWVVAGSLTLIGALVIAELSSAFPRTGGVYVFLRETYGPAVAFLWGWAMFWTMHSGIIAVIAMVFAQYAGRALDLGARATTALAIAAVLSLSILNYRSVRDASAVQVVLTAIKVLALVAIIATAMMVPIGAVAAAAPAATDTDFPGISAFALALVAGLFAFGGWHMVSYAADETIDPTRTIPRSLLLGTIAVTVLYVGVNAAYLSVLTPGAVAASRGVAADFANATLGGAGSQIMTVLVVLSTLGALNGVILAGPRVYLAMANDGVLFSWAGAVHPRFQTPHRAILLQGIWSSLLVLSGKYRALFTRVVYTEWIFFGLLAAALFVLRRRATYSPAWRVWGYPILPAVFILSTVGIVGNQIAHDPQESALGLGLVLAGLPVFYIWARHQQPAVRRPDA